MTTTPATPATPAMTSRHPRLLRGRRRPARLLAALPLAALLGVAGCSSGKPEALETSCAVVLDGSGSGSAKDGFDAKAKLDATIVPFMKDRGCGTMAFAPITRSSKASRCRVNDVDLDPRTESTDDVAAIRQEAMTKAVLAARTMLKCAQETDSGSDILGGLARAAEALPSGDGPTAMLVVSDFEQADPEFNLSPESIATPEARTGAVEKLVGPRGVPELSGTDVYPVGYGMSRRAKPSEYEPFDAFWTEILERRAKARVHDDYRR
ncbi:hypothetical protein DEJ50_04800 [Streptomyces venezuelae]|uniref:VWA domain-containing protein n=1 Tax=Streptomyces venezuelae TaxID=54571 RepID=A0A5P2D1L9_STRVZ|nr:hypothetical protein [Streptomyces venezuelae]QES47251.1 hypothetical protein DEJ50_04800 [Streptomyces venezuelae]